MAKKIEWKTESRKVADLIPAEYNPRKLSDKSREELMQSVVEFGQVEPVVVNVDNTIIGGHQRIKIYADLKIEEIIVRVPSRRLSDEEERRLNLRLNKNVGEWDWEKLAEFDKELLSMIGFTDEDMRMGFGLSNAETEEVDEDRMQILTVLPPESPKLKEKAHIHILDIKDYNRVKKAILSGKITADDLVELASKK